MICTKILEEKESKFNGHLRVLRTWGMGTYISAQGLTQSGGIVEDIWRSTLRKIKTQKSKLKSCLILGLGGGTVAKLIKKNWEDVKITGVDIDPIIVELGKKYLGLDDINVKIIIKDASLYTTYDILHTRFDLIVVDLYQGDKFPAKFATKNYIHLVRSLLSSEGIAVFNRLSFKGKKEEAEKFGEKLKEIFNEVVTYYPVSNIMFLAK